MSLKYFIPKIISFSSVITHKYVKHYMKDIMISISYSYGTKYNMTREFIVSKKGIAHTVKMKGQRMKKNQGRKTGEGMAKR